MNSCDGISVTSKKSPKVDKICPNMNSEKLKILTPIQKLPKNVGDLGKLIVLKSCQKSNKLANLVTLDGMDKQFSEK